METYKLTYFNEYRRKEGIVLTHKFPAKDDTAALEKARGFIKEKQAKCSKLEQFTMVCLDRILRAEEKINVFDNPDVI